MEVLIEKKEGIEDKNERCKQNGVETETFTALIEEERLESSSSSDIFFDIWDDRAWGRGTESQ